MVRGPDLPDDHRLRIAHRKSIYHRAEIEVSSICGCFHCGKMFKPDEMREWTDLSKPEPEQTALCPHCGIDSVLGDASGFEITDGFLQEMKRTWF